MTYVCQPLRDLGGRVEGAVTVVTDVTQAVEAIANAPQDEALFKAALDAIATPIVLCDPDTLRIVFANAAARTVARSELTRGTLFGQAVGSDTFCTDSAGAPIPDAMLPVARASRGEIVDGMDLVWHTPSGVFAFLCFAEKVAATDKLPPVIVLSCFDLSRVVRIEERLGAFLSARDEFLSLVAHELRTPLTALRLQSQSLARMHPDVAGLGAIERATDRMQTLVDQLMSVAQLLQPDFHLNPTDLDLPELVDGVVRRLARDALRAGCSVTHVGPRPLRVRCDRRWLEQVVEQLLRNAFRFGAGKPVTVACEDRRERVAIVVTDQGIGVDPAHQERIFQRFARATSARHYGGLGLWMTREILTRMGGTIAVRSAPDQGSAFRVELRK